MVEGSVGGWGTGRKQSSACLSTGKGVEIKHWEMLPVLYLFLILHSLWIYRPTQHPLANELLLSLSYSEISHSFRLQTADWNKRIFIFYLLLPLSPRDNDILESLSVHLTPPIARPPGSLQALQHADLAALGLCS